jgi:Pathogenicity locus
MAKRLTTAEKTKTLEDIPNIGKAIAADLRVLGIETPAQLKGRDAYEMYDELCRVTGIHHDPCLLDTFIAAVSFMNGGPNLPWWAYTKDRKQTLLERERVSAAH